MKRMVSPFRVLLMAMTLILCLAPTKAFASQGDGVGEQGPVKSLSFTITGYKVGEAYSAVQIKGDDAASIAFITEDENKKTYNPMVCTYKKDYGYSTPQGTTFDSTSQYAIFFYAEQSQDYEYDDDSIKNGGVTINGRKADKVTVAPLGGGVKMYSISSLVSVEGGVQAENSEPSTKLDLKDADIATIAEQKFTGNAITPEVSVSYGQNKLVKDTDYTVGYNNNTAPGTATVTVIGKGKYTGSKTATFTIKKDTQSECGTKDGTENKNTNPAVTNPGTGDQNTDGSDEGDAKEVKAPGKVTIKSFKSLKKKQGVVTWTELKGVDGYEIQYSTVKKLKSNVKSKTVIGKKKLTLKNLKKGKKYYVRVRAFVKDASGEKVYGKWSKTLNVKIKKK